MLNVNAALIDLDNTLLECLLYYEQAKQDVWAMIERAETSVTQERFLDTYMSMGRALFVSHGYGRSRFPLTLQRTVEALLPGEPGMAGAAFHRANEVFNAPYPLYPGVRDALIDLKQQGLALAILTKGDPEVQQRKVHIHGLDQVVDEVFIVPEKGKKEIAAGARALGTDVRHTAVIGDSLRDDIKGGLEAGARTVWVNHNPIHLPEADGALPDVEPHHTIRHFPEILDLVQRIQVRRPAARPMALGRR